MWVSNVFEYPYALWLLVERTDARQQALQESGFERVHYGAVHEAVLPNDGCEQVSEMFSGGLFHRFAVIGEGLRFGRQHPFGPVEVAAYPVIFVCHLD